jgi:hypothetical protein
MKDVKMKGGADKREKLGDYMYSVRKKPSNSSRRLAGKHTLNVSLIIVSS